MSKLDIFISFLIGILMYKVSGQRNLLSDACDSWNNFDRRIVPNVLDQLLCNANQQCTGVQCSLKYKGYKGRLHLVLQPCSKPLSVQVQLTLPQLNIFSWNHTIVDGDRVPLPQTNSSTAANIESKCLMTHLHRWSQFTVTFGFSIVECVQSTDEASSSITVIKNETFRLPPCLGDWPPKLVRQSAIVGQPSDLPAQPDITSNKDVTMDISEEKFQAVVADEEAKPCHLDLTDTCGDKEICEQTAVHSTKGVCYCLAPYQRNSDGICTSVPSSSGEKVITDRPSSSPIPDPSTAQVAIEIAVPIVLIVLIAVLIVLGYRYRWINKLRARFRRSRVYEEMVIDSDEVASMHSQGLDPVA